MSVVSGGSVICTMCHVHVEVRRKFLPSECVLNIRVSELCGNIYFKELFVLKVTFVVTCLKNFVTCVRYSIVKVTYL